MKSKSPAAIRQAKRRARLREAEIISVRIHMKKPLHGKLKRAALKAERDLQEHILLLLAKG